MKQYLLVVVTCLPSLLLAQPAPTLSFTPADGAVNVSTTANIIVNSDHALNMVGGTDLSDANAAQFVQLKDEGGNDVNFSAEENMGRRRITINPVGALLENHTYTLTVIAVESDGGNQTPSQQISFTTGDFTAPVFNTAKGIMNVGSDFIFRVNVNESATVYYIVDRNPGTPDVSDIRNGKISNGTTDAEFAGSFTVTANTDKDEAITGLDFTPPAKFTIYFFAEDNATTKNTTAPTSRGLPLLKSSSIPSSSVESDQFNLRVEFDEGVTTYYVVTASPVAPSSQQIRAGEDENGDAGFTSGNFAVAGNTPTNHTITGLDDLTQYWVHFFGADATLNESIVGTVTATTADGTGPSVTALTPPNNSLNVDISTKTFTITFDENVREIDDDPTGFQRKVHLYEDGVWIESVDRDDGNVGATGAITTSGNTATITFMYNLLPFKSYHIIVGNEVFEDTAGDPGQSNPFTGLSVSTDWNFTTSGVTVNNITSNICSGSFQSISNIVISENGTGDFNTGTDRELLLSLSNSAEFAIANSGVLVTGLSSDITGLSITVGLSTLTVKYTVTGTSVIDNITISGLKVYATGAAASTTVIRTGGSADQDGNNGTHGSSLTYATINVGSNPPSPPQLEAAQDLIHCIGEDITGKTLTLADQGPAVTYNWYRDSGLTDLAKSTADESVNIVTDLGLVSPAQLGTKKFFVVAVSACQSAPPTEVTIVVGSNPVADAGPDRVGGNAICTGTELILGGNPTLLVPSAPGPYTYSWNHLESATEPAPLANPTYAFTNASPTSALAYNFEVTVTDANGCFGTDVVTIEVQPTFTVSLVSPTSFTFTPNSPNQILEAVPGGGVFSGVGVVQSSSSPVSYQFSPAIAHATDPTTLSKSFDIFYTVTQGGCTITDYPIATFTLSNSFFSTLQPEYCSDEYPNVNTSTVLLGVDASGQTYLEDQATYWNTSGRLSRVPAWQASLLYPANTYVRLNTTIYRCNAASCLGILPPDLDGNWVNENTLQVEFTGYISNFYENYYGGNATSTTVVKASSTYTVNGKTYNHYRFGTDVNYIDCPSCNYAWPAAYLEFVNPEDVKLMFAEWVSTRNYYAGNLVRYGSDIYKCTAPSYTLNTPPPSNPGLWLLVTNADYSDGYQFHKWDATAGRFRSGYYVNGQYVQINRNPAVFFNGLINGQDVCQFNVLDLDNPVSSAGMVFDLTGNFASLGLSQSFSVKLDGSATFNTGGGAIVNEIGSPGKAKFNTLEAFTNSTGGASGLKNIEIRYQVDPGTKGSASQSCYGSSSIVVQVVQNSAFDFDNSIVDPDESVYCYTEPTKNLRSLFNGSLIAGPAGAPNSVAYSGYGVSDLGNSLGTFRPGIAIDQVSPGTTVQQDIPVTALYRDANQCRSKRVRTFKVNPDIQPSFTFGGRVNYCYEDIPNPLTGHIEDYTDDNGPVTSTGRYRFLYRDPGNTQHQLLTVNSSNASFTAQSLYDDVQAVLTSQNFNANLNQSINVDVVYIETLNAGAVCNETFSQTMVINPPVVLDIFGLNNGDFLCRNNNANIAQGNVVTFEGSVTGSGIFKLDDDADFTAVNPTLNGTVNTLSGKATINLLSAYNAASDPADPKQVFLQYEYTAPGCTGPAEVIKDFEISAPPALAFDTDNSPPNLDIFCNDDAPVQLQTEQNVNVTVSGYGVTEVGTGSGVATFNPQLAFSTSISNGGSSTQKQNIVVSARIRDAIGCENVAEIVYVVNPVPPKDVTFEKTDFCYEDAPALISSALTRSWYEIEYLGVTTPHTEQIGNINAPQKSFSFNPGQRFDDATVTYGASTLTPVNFNVTYFTADADNCIASNPPKLISVANQIDVTIAGIEDEIYCSNENKGKKILTFNPFPADASKRQLTINGGPVAVSTDKYTFEPGLAGGDYLMRYVVFSGENNCSNTGTLQVKVLPSPEAIFEAPPACNGDLIPFTALGNNTPDALYTWTLSDVVKTGKTVDHQFPASNIYGVKLHVRYPAYNNDPALVCQDSLRLDQTVGAVPNDLGFEFFNVCEQDATSFQVQPDVPISRFSWDFGDGITTGFGFSASNIAIADPNTTGTYQAPSHKYASAGGYAVVLTGKTADVFGGCERTEVHNISILKNWSPTATDRLYDMSKLDGGRGFWVVEDAGGNALWEFAAAAKKHIVTDEQAWITGETAPYKPEDDSYVNSPCFDLSGFLRPVFSLQHWTSTESSDGAVVQYSIDGGQEWQRLGNVGSGIDWYDRPTISSNPGQQNGLTSGWSRSDQRAWTTGKHTLDGIPGERKQVRFRVAFSSFNNGEALDGFAFKNVVIEERNRTILVENFTNEAFTNNNLQFRNFRSDAFGAFNNAELVKLQYHHASAQGPDPDNFHKANPTDQNARAAFYGIANPVRAFVDGGFGQSSTNATFESVAAVDTYFSLRSLVSSPVAIDVAFVNEPSDRLNIRAKVQAIDNLGAPGEYNVFIAVAENAVDGQSYVLRKFLPSASGTPLTSLSATDAPQEINVSYDMRHITRLTDGSFAPFSVIVFVQHLETKDVIQTTMRQDGTAPSQIVTGVESPYDNLLHAYPNPADDLLNVILPSPVERSTPVKIFDNFGREVYAGTFETGEHLKTLSTKELASGVYLIQLATPRGIVLKKVMVIHE